MSSHPKRRSVRRPAQAGKLPWFRFHVSALENRKVQALPGELFKAWVNTLCIARSCGGILPSLENVAFAMRMSADACADVLRELETRKLLDRKGDVLRPHDFNMWQYESDISTKRVQKFRKRQGKQLRNVSETAPESEADTDTDHKQKQREKKPPPRPKGALPEDWNPSQNTIDSAKRFGLSGNEIEKMVRRFGPHYRARQEIRADWDQQFLAWAADEANKLNRSSTLTANAEPKRTLDPAWVPIRNRLAESLDGDVLAAWFADAGVVSQSEDHIVIGAPNKFIRNYWNREFCAQIGRAVKSVYPKVETVRFEVLPKESPAQTLN